MIIITPPVYVYIHLQAHHCDKEDDSEEEGNEED